MFGVSLETIRLETRSQYAKITIFSKNRHVFREYLENGWTDFQSVNCVGKVLLRATTLPPVRFSIRVEIKELRSKNRFGERPFWLCDAVASKPVGAGTQNSASKKFYEFPTDPTCSNGWTHSECLADKKAPSRSNESLKLHNLLHCPKKSERMNLSRDFFGNNLSQVCLISSWTRVWLDTL